MTIRYGSVCSGVEAASLAWEPLGWQPAWFAEIEPFPAAVLVERDGVREWVKVVEYADGRKYGFVWRDGDWYRTAWVEERFLGRKVTPRFAEGDEAYPDAGLARWRNGY